MKNIYVLILLVVLVFIANTSNATDRNVGPGKTYATIQAAIDAANPSDIINVYPGNYSETAIDRSPISISGTYTFGLYISPGKNGIIIRGVDAGGNPITSYIGILANVETNATDNFGPDGVFMECDNVTITGLKIWQNPASGLNKTVTIIGNNFTMKYCRITDISVTEPWGSLYIDDELYNTGTNTSHIQSYTIDGNWFDNCSIDPNNGAGFSGPVSGRKIINNKIQLGSWAGASISFSGSGTGVPWFVHGVGGAIITGNTFLDNSQHIRVRGDYDNSQFNWNSYWNDNSFDRAVITGINPPSDIREYSYVGGYGTINHVRRIGGIIQNEIDNAQNSDIVKVAAGTYNIKQININKPISLVGAGSATTIINGRGTLDTINDGSDGMILYQNISTGSVTFDGFKIQNITFELISGLYWADAITFYNVTTPITVKNCKFIGSNYGHTIDDFASWAIYTDGSSTAPIHIQDNEIMSCTYGIAFEINGPCTIERNYLHNMDSCSYLIDLGTQNNNLSSAIIRNNNMVLPVGNNYGTYGIFLEGYYGGVFQNADISNNNISGQSDLNSYGITIMDSCVNTQIKNNVLSNIYSGVWESIYSNIPAGTVVHNNSLTNIPEAVSTDRISPPQLDARYNWWGSVTGPSGPGGSGSGSGVGLNVNFDPWIGKPIVNMPVSVTSTPIDLPGTGATIQFSHIGSNNVNPTITVQRIDGLPNTPASAGTPIPVYFQITATNLANYTFEATIVLDVSSIPAFNANTLVMMSPDGITGWVASNGTYNAGAHTYTFTTNHFSTIAFVNPVLANEVNLYVSTSTTSYSNTVYPNTSWNTPLSTGTGDAINWDPTLHEPDWTYKVKTGTFYIIPVGSLSSPRSFYASTIKIVWNPNIVSGLTVTEGNFFNNGSQPSLFTTNRGSNWVIIDASCLTQNQTPDGIKSIATLTFTFDGSESGFSGIAIDAVTLLYMDGSNAYEATPVTQNMGGKFKCYLGDFVSTGPPIDSTTGDGLINGTDLAKFSAAYWSVYNTTGTLYKSKYDVGPTTPARYYFGKPTPDGTIGFEDLAIFAMGYSKSGSGTLPDNPKPIIFSLDNISKEANGTLRLPVRISGSINDLRAYSMKLNYSNDMEYKGVEMSGEMLEGTNFLIGKSETGKVITDGASFGTGLSKEGVIAYVLFNEKTAGNHYASIESVIARNSGNLDLEVNFAGMNNGVGVPKTFSLNQNYPNPFNPLTKIEYALPNDAKVTIKIYDMLGREVNVFVNEVKKAGYYSVEWNGSQLSSGVYFYKMQAGDFNAVKKMMLIK
jgi:hypothetical protein